MQQVADRCACTRSLLSKIETGAITPALATLDRIATALGVTAAALFADDTAHGTVHTPAATVLRDVATTAKGYDFHAFAAARHTKVMQPILFTARRGEVTSGGLHHGGEEFVYVLAGRMRYQVGAATWTLGPGDSLYFDAEETHDLEPLSDEVRFLAVFGERSAPRETKPVRTTAPKKATR